MRNLTATICLTIAVLLGGVGVSSEAKAAGESSWLCKAMGVAGLEHRFVVTLPAYGSGTGTIVLTQPEGDKREAYGRAGRVGTGRLVWKSETAPRGTIGGARSPQESFQSRTSSQPPRNFQARSISVSG